MARRGGQRGFPGGGGNMQGMLRQVQKFQAEMEQAQAELQAAEVEGSAGGGAVTCRINGSHELVALTILPDVIDPEDPEMLQDLIIAAVNQATAAFAELSATKMARFEQAGAGMMSGLGF